MSAGLGVGSVIRSELCGAEGWGHMHERPLVFHAAQTPWAGGRQESGHPTGLPFCWLQLSLTPRTPVAQELPGLLLSLGLGTGGRSPRQPLLSLVSLVLQSVLTKWSVASATATCCVLGTP